MVGAILAIRPAALPSPLFLHRPDNMRLSLRAAGFLALAIVAITCTDAPTGPNSSQSSVQTARLRMSPYFTPEAAKVYNSLALFGQEVTEIHIHLTAADGTQRDTVINFPAGQDSLVIEIPVPVSSNDQQFTAVIELRNDQHTVLFSGTQTVTARASNLPPLTPPAVHIDYTGPGRGTKTVSVAPVDPTVAASATIPFSATAVDSSGKAVSDLLVRWTTSDATIAAVTLTSNNTASVVGQGKRGTVTISAITPTNIIGTSRVTFVPPPARIVVISGGTQTGVAGSVLPQPLVVEVQATDNLPVPGANVTFRSISAGGSVATATATTDATGRASTTMTLPNVAGTYQYEAASGTLTAATVSETATPAQPALIALVSGDQQVDSLGRVLPLPLVAKVTDQFGGAVNAATVNWTKVSGAGTIASTSVVTGVDGLASTSYTLGTVVGPDTVRATVVGVNGAAGSVLFSMRAIARGANGLTIISGGGQSGLPGAALPTPLVARLVDALNNPVGGANVVWSASGAGATFNPGAGTTAANGQVSTVATLGATPGPVTVTATSGTLTGTTSLTVTTPPVVLPPTMTKTAGDGQNAIAGTAVVVKPTVVIKDGNGVPTQGAPVVFAVASGGGIATGTTATTDANGVAVVGNWTLGTTAGPNTLTATSGSLSATFTATGTAGVANKLAFVQAPPASIGVGVTIAPISVRLTDVNGNPVMTQGTNITLTGAITPNTNPNITQTQATDATGTATFNLPVYTGTSGSVIFTATAPGTSALVSLPVPITAGVATKLVILTQPAATVPNNTAFTPAPVVQVSDAGGNPISTSTTITATIGSGGGTLSGLTGVPTGGSAVATFTGLIIAGPAGAQTIVFSAPGLTSVTSNPTSIVAGAVTTIAKNAGDAQSATAGTSVAIAPSVLVTDVTGNPVPNVTVTFAITTGGGSVTAASPVTNASGIATVGSWTLGAAVGANSLTATAGAASAVFTANGTAGVAAKLKAVGVFPTTIVVGTALPLFQVQLADANGNAVAQAGVNVTFTATLQPGSLVHTFTVPTDAGGIASYPVGTYDDPIGTLTLSFTAPGTTPYSPPNITVLTGAAAKFIMKTQPPANAILNTPLSPQPAVQLTDIGGNPVATAGIQVTARIISGGGTLNGASTVPTDATGAATYTNLSISGPLGLRQLGFANVAFDSTVSNTIVMGVGAAQNLIITAGAGPQTAAVNSNVATNPTVRVTDQFGNGVGGIGVTFTPRNGSRANGGTTPVTLTSAPNGFANVSWTLGGAAGNLADSLDVTSGSLNGSPLLFVANATAGPATFLVGVFAPNATASGSVLSPAPTVRVVDGNFNPVAGVRSVSVGILSGSPTLSGTTTLNTDASGVATFSDLVITGVAGARTLSYTSAGLVTYNNTVSITAGAATKLGFLVPWNLPGNATSGSPLASQPVVQLLDANSNAVPLAGVVVTATVASGPSVPTPTLTSATATTNASGQATFVGLALTGAAGTYTLTFAAPPYTAVSPGTLLSVVAGTPAAVAINAGEGQSTQVGTFVPAAPAVKVTDASGNGVAGVNVTFTAVTPGSQVQIGAATATSLSTTTNLAGIASAGWQVSTTAGTQTMSVTAGALAGSPLTFHATATSATAVKMTVLSGTPASVTVGAPIATPVLVQITDAFGNAVSQTGVNIQATATVQPSNQTFGGSATTNASGVASIALGTFSGQIGAATITFVSGGLSPNTTGSFPVTAGAASKLVVAVQPPNTTVSGAQLTPQPSVQIADVGGNAVGVSGQHVLASVTPAGASITGTLDIVTNAQGVASYTDLAVSASVSVRQLTFTNTTYGTVNSNVFNVTAGAATKLAITTPPSPATTSGAALSQQPAIQLQDASGNAVLTSGVVVTATLASGTGSLTNATATTNASGVATFSGLTISGAPGSFTLKFDALPLAAVTSGTVILTVGPLYAITVTPGNPSVSVPVGTTITFLAVGHDVSGNIVPVTPTWSVANGGGTIDGTTGAFTGSGLIGTYTNTIHATSGSVIGLASVNLTVGAAASVYPVAGGKITTPLSGNIAVNTVKFQVHDTSSNPLGANITVTFAVEQNTASCTPSSTSAVTAADGTVSVGYSIGEYPGICIVHAMVAGADVGIAKIVVVPAGATHAWVSDTHGSLAALQSFETASNWVKVSNQSAEVPSGASAVPYIPQINSGYLNSPVLSADRSIGGVVMDGAGTLDLGSHVLTTSGNIVAINQSDNMPSYFGGKVIANGHNVDVSGAFDNFTAGTAGGCTGVNGDVANLQGVYVVHNLIANCGLTVGNYNSSAGGLVALPGSFVTVSGFGNLSVADSAYFRGDSLTIHGTIDVTGVADLQGQLAMSGEIPSLTIGSHATFRGTGALSQGNITVHGNATFGGAGSDGYTFTGGQLQVDGNFSQLNGTTSATFVANGNHFEWFSGFTAQTISFQDGDLSPSSLGTVSINSVGGVTFLTGSTQPSGGDYPRSIFIQDGTLTVPSSRTVNLDGALYLTNSPAHLVVEGTMTVGYCNQNDGVISGGGTINGETPSSLSCYSGGSYNKMPKRIVPRTAPKIRAAVIAKPRVR